MKKTKKFVFLSVLVTFACVGSFIGVQQSMVLGTNAAECEHDLRHHDRVNPGDETPGNVEYYACCSCHRMFEDAAATKEITNITESITNPSDGRYLAPLMTPLDFGTHKMADWGGGWAYNGSSGTVNDEGWFNNFSTTDIKAEANQDIRFSADVTMERGYLHLCVGVANYNDPGAGWYAMVINYDDDCVRIGAEKKGTMGSGTGLHSYNMGFGEAANKHKLTIEAYASGAFKGYVDGVQVIETFDHTYNGGYLAFATFHGKASFENVRYQVISNAETSFQIKTLSPYNAKGYATLCNWGTWSQGADSVTGENKTSGNVFSMSSIYQESNQDLVLEADVSIKGNNAAIVYGVAANNDPGAGWYAFNLSGASGTVRAASEAGKSGDIGISRAGISIPSTDWKQATEEATAKIKFEAFASGVMKYYLNGTLVDSLTATQFNGGFIGFLTFYSNVVFSNIKIQLTNAA